MKLELSCVPGEGMRLQKKSWVESAIELNWLINENEMLIRNYEVYWDPSGDPKVHESEIYGSTTLLLVACAPMHQMDHLISIIIY